MKIIKTGISLFIACVVSLALFGCNNGNAGGDIEIIVWEDEANHEWVKDGLNEFAQRYKNTYKLAQDIKFTLIAQTEQQAIEALTNLGPTGHGADVLAFVHNQVGAAYQSNLLAPIEYVDQVVFHNDEKAVAALTLDDVIYGYPTTGETSVLMYDEKQVSAEAVKTLEGINTAGKKISWQIKDDAYYTFGFLSDANVFGEDGKNKNSLKLDNPLTVENLLYLYGPSSLARQTINAEDPDSAIDSLRTGASAGVVTTPYLWPIFKKLISDKGGTPKVAVLPKITVNGTERELLPYAGYKAYGVSSFTKHPHLSQAVANFLSSEICQIRRVIETNCLPTIKDSSDLDDLVANSPEATIYLQQLAHSRTMPNITLMEEMWSPGENALTSLYNNKSLTKENIETILQSWQSGVLSKR